jgi:hypothetical protein
MFHQCVALHRECSRRHSEAGSRQTVARFLVIVLPGNTAASAMENLLYEFLRTPQSPDHSVVIAKIEKINGIRNEGIVGKSAPQPTGATNKHE